MFWKNVTLVISLLLLVILAYEPGMIVTLDTKQQVLGRMVKQKVVVYKRSRQVCDLNVGFPVVTGCIEMNNGKLVRRLRIVYRGIYYASNSEVRTEEIKLFRRFFPKA